MRTRRLNSRKGSDQGAVLIELAFVLPLIFLILAAVYELGRYFSNVSWLAQAGYQTALVGGLQAPGLVTKLRMNERYAQMRGLYTAKELVWDHMNAQTDANQLLVEAELSGMFKFQFLQTFFRDIPLAIRVIGPVLARPVGGIGSLSRFCDWDQATRTAINCPS